MHLEPPDVIWEIKWYLEMPLQYTFYTHIPSISSSLDVSSSFRFRMYFYYSWLITLISYRNWWWWQTKSKEEALELDSGEERFSLQELKRDKKWQKTDKVVFSGRKRSKRVLEQQQLKRWISSISQKSQGTMIGIPSISCQSMRNAVHTLDSLCSHDQKWWPKMKEGNKIHVNVICQRFIYEDVISIFVLISSFSESQRILLAFLVSPKMSFEQNALLELC